MCGIAGIMNLNGNPVALEQIDQLTDAVAHRGPDGRGVWFNAEKNLALGHRRLSILDVSELGRQPMSYAGGRYWITLNGEIYNFLELREELKKAGMTFQSESDTEVVLAAYKVWGAGMQDRFNGMWALAIYDTVEKTLFLSRDRFGVKPLYYYNDGNRFIFSSEVQAIHRLLGRSQQVNRKVIRNIIEGELQNFGTTETYLEDVYSLPGGYELLLKEGKVAVAGWYSLKKVKVPDGFAEQAEKFRELIHDAALLRMRSDVPVATCLSGGLDSGTITALISSYKPEGNSRFSHYTHKGFCAAFPGTPLDESQDAIRLGKQLNSEVDVFEVKPPAPEELLQALEHCDGPMASLAFYPIWSLYNHIRKNKIIVTLDGQGPDEMLGGYRPLREALEAAWELRRPLWMRDVYRTYASIGETSQFSAKQFAKKELRLLRQRKFGNFKRRVKNIVRPSAGTTPPARSASVNTLVPVRTPDPRDNALDQKLFRQFFQFPLPGILQQYDRCSMANGVECRMPFMDYRVVEFAFSLPVDAKVGGGYTKRILREATKGILPDETRLNKRKIGFNAPIVDWFRAELKEFMLAQMNTPTFLGSTFFDGKKLRKEFEEFLAQPVSTWAEAWKFWPPVHLTWWLGKYTDHS